MLRIEEHYHSKELLEKICHIALKKDVCRELGYPIFSDKKHYWYLLFFDTELIGFCAAIDKGKYISFNHDYIEPDYRQKSYYDLLFKKRFDKFKNRTIKAAATKKSVSTFKRYGFKITKTTKNYTFLTWNK